MEIITYHVKLITSHTDALGYISYVFEDLEYQDYDFKYLMCVRFPNWEQPSFDYGDEGYVTIRYIREGIDKWFDGTNFIPYNYTNLMFVKFIPAKEKINISEIVLD